MKQKTIELLMEIQGICIGAESPDALELERVDPMKELHNCKVDLRAISRIVDKILEPESRVRWLVCAWDYNLVYGYLCKDNKGNYEISDRTFAVKYKTREQAERAIEKLKNGVYGNLDFRLEKYKGE